MNNNPPNNEHKYTEEELKRKNKFLIEKINTWQSFKYVKPLTCQKDGCGCPLVAKEHRLKVILQCPKCKTIQAYIPRSVMQSDLVIFND
jgi:hypothetical protein